jgi:hypothetical protein
MQVKAPNKFSSYPRPYVFLAGSIEMGSARNWQDEAALKLPEVTVLNPRRDDWDSSWVQSIENDQFREQIEWELYAMESSALILMHFEPSTRSPITLLEFGLWAKTGRLIVHCPEGFWRKGNVDIVCKRYTVMEAQSIEDMIQKAKIRLSLAITEESG